MFSRARNYENCIQRVRLNIGKDAGLESDEEAFIVLKELPTMDMLRIKDATAQGESAILALLKELLPSIIVDHNFYEDAEGKKKMTTEALSLLIFESLTLTSRVVKEYTNAAFFTRTKESVENSLPSALKSSQDTEAKSSSRNTVTG